MSTEGLGLKPIDAWWTVLAIDPVAVRVLPLILRRSAITPNRTSAAAFVVGVFSVLSFATGHWVLGAALYELRFLLDCLDGKIARVLATSSRFGAAFDRLADALTVPATYGVIGVVLASQGDLSPELALLPALASTLVSVVELLLDLARTQRDDTVPAHPVQPTPPGGVRGWMSRRRLTLRPWTVEAETLGLFLGPLLLRGRSLALLELSLVGVYGLFVLVDVRFLAADTREADRRRRVKEQAPTADPQACPPSPTAVSPVACS